VAGLPVPGPAPQRAVGVVAPFDLALDRELWRWVPDEVSLLLTRTHHLDAPVSVAMAESLGDHAAVRQATRDLVTVEPEVVAYACTSASFVGGLAGEEALRAAMRAGGAPAAVTTSGALLAALRALSVRTVAVATPYVEELNDRLRGFFAEAGIDTVADTHLGLTGEIWKVPYARVAELVARADSPSAEAVFVSCTNLPTYDLIAPLEAALGKPVLTANQVTLWAALRALGVRAAGPGQRLLTVTCPPDPS
jgi:maleate isomerase